MLNDLVQIHESRATAPYGPCDATGDLFADEWKAFVCVTEAWIEASFHHTHYLATDHYLRAFDHLFLMVARLRKALVSISVIDTGDGDERDQITLQKEHTYFKIRPL